MNLPFFRILSEGINTRATRAKIGGKHKRPLDNQPLQVTYSILRIKTSFKDHLDIIENSN